MLSFAARPWSAGAMMFLLLLSMLVLPPAGASSPPYVVTDQAGLRLPIGTTTMVGFQILDDDGCDYSAANRVTLDILPSAGVGVFPSRLVYDACGVWRYANVTANALGRLVITIGAQDSRGTFIDTTRAAIEVIVHVPADPYPPIITTAPDQTVEAIGPGGGRALVWASAVDPIQGSISGAKCTPGGPIFPINATLPGRTWVQCIVTDASGNIDNGGFWITVVDTTPPILPSLADQDATAAPDGIVTYRVPPAYDIVSLDVALDCTPASGTIIPEGIIPVSCTATDRHGNVARGGFFLLNVHDVTPPTIFARDITITTFDPAGAPATFKVTFADATDPTPRLECTRASGSLFAIGDTPVTCTAIDHAGNRASAPFTIHVILLDVTAPILTLPPSVTLEATGPGGATHAFTASAFDATDGALPVTCDPPSGALFPLGVTIVTCWASDARGNVVSGSFRVSVRDTTPPTLTLPASLARLGPGPVSWSPASADIVDASPDVSCTPTSGSAFPIGLTTVTCTSTDDFGNARAASFDVRVTPPAPPTIAPHPDVLTIATSLAGASVTYTLPSAADGLGAPLHVICSPASGAFPLGSTEVVCSATDAFGQRVTTSFRVIVSLPPPPTIGALPDLRLEATGPAGARATFTAPIATSGTGGALAVTCAPASGSTFALGTTTVVCSATDAFGRSVTSSFRVIVVDTTPPSLTLPASVAGLPGAIGWNASALDLVDGATTLACTPPSGSTFAAGTTLVTCSSTDAHGNVATRTFNVVATAPSGCDIDGFRPPIDTPGHTKTGVNAFKAGSTVPVKIQIDCDGKDVTKAPKLYYAWVNADGSLGPEKSARSSSTDKDNNTFRRNGNHWQLDWDTTGLAKGSYRLRVDIGDGKTWVKAIDLR